jgi:hypothetical protein
VGAGQAAASVSGARGQMRARLRLAGGGGGGEKAGKARRDPEQGLSSGPPAHAGGVSSSLRNWRPGGQCKRQERVVQIQGAST